MLALAAASKSPSAWDEPGTLGFLVVFGMGVILYFVFRSLAKHLRKINDAARLEAEQVAAMQAEDGQSAESPSATFADGPRPLADGQVIGPPAENGRQRRG
jgi:hypothetical protein